MASIVKILDIKSKEHLYKVINHNGNLSSDKIFTVFMDSMYIYYNGCNCNFDLYDKDSDKEYSKISNDLEIISKLKEYFKCEKVIFN